MACTGAAGLARGYSLAVLEAQVHGDVVAGAALAGFVAAQDGVNQAAGDAKAAGQFGFGKALLVHPLAGFGLGSQGCFHGCFGGGWLVVGVKLRFNQ